MSLEKIQDTKDAIQDTKDAIQDTNDEKHYVRHTYNKDCINGMKCHFSDCKFTHPQGRLVCESGKECSQTTCKSAHPRGFINPCRNGYRCKNSDCDFKHPASWKICRNGNKCQLNQEKNCKFAHPKPASLNKKRI